MSEHSILSRRVSGSGCQGANLQASLIYLISYFIYKYKASSSLTCLLLSRQLLVGGSFGFRLRGTRASLTVFAQNISMCTRKSSDAEPPLPPLVEWWWWWAWLRDDEWWPADVDVAEPPAGWFGCWPAERREINLRILVLRNWWPRMRPPVSLIWSRVRESTNSADEEAEVVAG